MALSSISQKTNCILRLVLAALFLIMFRIWHLSVLQREEKLLEAHKSQRKTHLIKANRGTICDRFHIPLALNRICYNAAIYYSHIAQIPASCWKSDERGAQKKVFPRKEYIKNLSLMIAEELGIDPLRAEDEIHSKASLFPHAPYIIKADLTEKEHFRLCQLEREWPGLHAEISSERFYPLGKAAADIIGTMGSINAREYHAIAQEMEVLLTAAQSFEEGAWEDLPSGYERIEDVYRRLHELKEKAYTFNDRIGKTGIEATFEEQLRGYFGKKSTEINRKGQFVRDLPSSRPAIAGKQIVLSLSSELQQFAEGLLAQDEKAREGRSIGFDASLKKRTVLKQPWIKGGAIVAMDPNTGEILAMAGYPRFDPNDFIPSGPDKGQKTKQINRWLENERFIADLWDGRQCLTRERFSRGFYEEKTPLTWDFYLQQILPSEGPLRTFFERFSDVKAAIQIQEDFDSALYYTNVTPQELFEALPIQLEKLQSNPDALACLKRLESAFYSIPSHQDKLFAIDLFRIAVYSAAFSDELIHAIGPLKIAAYFSLNQEAQECESIAKETAFKRFHSQDFQIWKEAHQKEFLAKKRQLEKINNTYARPYLDYLDKKEKKLFKAYWDEHRLEALAELLNSASCPKEAKNLQIFFHTIPDELQAQWLRTFRSYQQLDRPLFGSYKKIRKPYTEKNLASAFYPTGGFGFSRSCAFQMTTPPGSIFKLLSAYAFLSQNHPPFSMIDQRGFDYRAPPSKAEIVGYTLNNTPYPRYYKGGRLPRSHAPNIGKINLTEALEQSSNPYFSLLAGDFLSDPEDLVKTARLFGYGEKSGIDLPNEASGWLPIDLKTNRTGLYSSAIGQHTTLTTPLQIASMLAAFANGGQLIQPRLAKEIIGPSPDRSSLEPFEAESYFAKEQLHALGIHFPLFTAAQARTQEIIAFQRPSQIKRKIPLSPAHQKQIFEGMDKAIWGSKGSARPSVIKGLLTHPLWMRDYLALQHQMIGKTSTAEIELNLDINPSGQPHIYKHIGFGAISFASEKSGPSPELVVVVFLRYGDGGKEAAPLASQIIHKWREIRLFNERTCSK
jgi:cell division protein FtsI/penicillin-binding protein 2